MIAGLQRSYSRPTLAGRTSSSGDRKPASDEPKAGKFVGNGQADETHASANRGRCRAMRAEGLSAPSIGGAAQHQTFNDRRNTWPASARRNHQQPRPACTHMHALRGAALTDFTTRCLGLEWAAILSPLMRPAVGINALPTRRPMAATVARHRIDFVDGSRQDRSCAAALFCSGTATSRRRWMT
jgi:hypothetical protein